MRSTISSAGADDRRWDIAAVAGGTAERRLPANAAIRRLIVRCRRMAFARNGGLRTAILQGGLGHTP